MKTTNILPHEKPVHCQVYFKARPARPETVEICYEDDSHKLIFELRIFDSKCARIERRELYDLNPEKGRYMTQNPAQYRDIEGTKEVKSVVADFMQKAQEIPLSEELSNYRTDVYYA